MTYAGILFTVIGGLLGFLLICVGWFSGMSMFYVLGTVFFVTFVTVGVWLLREGDTERREREEIVANGTRYTGVILEYRDGTGVIINDMPPLDIVVQYDTGDGLAEVTIPSGSHSESRFPLGAYVDFCVLDGKYAVVPNSVRL